MSRIFRLFVYSLAAFMSLSFLGLLSAAGLYLYLEPGLPSVEALRDVRFQQPLRVYSADGELMAEFGEYRREPLRYDEIPEPMKHAFIAAEDERFFQHPGVDYQGLARAVLHLVRHREIGPGGSTITMQVARNFFLSREQTYLRKLNEILLSFKIERELSKEQILELYLNKIYLGQRAYGVGAASRIYYGKSPEELSLAETATIAGLPKSPSTANPVSNPQRSLQRRAYVLRRMFETGHITAEELAEAGTTPETASLRTVRPGLHAPFVAEMARAHAYERYGDAAYDDGYRVYTTVDSRLQRKANEALRENLLSYDRRHGYRGPLAQHDLDEHASEESWDGLLAGHRRVADLRPALVTEVDDEAGEARVYLRNGDLTVIGLDDMKWARRWISQSAVGPQVEKVSDVLSRGDIVHVRQRNGDEPRYVLAQLPDVEGSVISLAPDSGAVVALAGGFDFGRSQFNRAAQALRQPGSAFKPFIYSAALERGFTPASIVNDAPVVFEDDALETVWRPENYTGRFYGPTRLREALAQSRNLVSIRVMRDIGARYVVNFMDRFGFPPGRLPADLSLALGSGAVTPLELTGAYAVFANGGYRVQPHLVSHIEDGAGEIVYRMVPALACQDCDDIAASMGFEPRTGDDADGVFAAQFRPAERVISAENAYQMTSMMQDVIRTGTARQARALGRQDLSGKTGTTNDLHDAWFAGYNRSLVTTAWVGFDQARSLGRGETGSRAALPMWMDFMGSALEGVPERASPRPSGLITARIDPESGLLTSADNPRAIFEIFQEDAVPARERQRDRSGSSSGGARGSDGSRRGSDEPLF